MASYEEQQARLRKQWDGLLREENEAHIVDDVHSDSEEDALEVRDTDSASEQEFSEAEETAEKTNESGLYYLGKDKTTKWRRHVPPKNVRTRSENKVLRLPSSRLITRDLKEPLDIWKHFINDNMLDIIVDGTNIFIESLSDRYSRDSDARLTNRAEVQALLGLIYYAGILKANHLNTKELWETNGSGVEIFRLTMSLNRFRFLLSSLRFDDKRTRTERKMLDKLAPIREFYDRFVENCKTGYSLSEFVTIDEKLEAFRGRCSFRQYIPSKPNKYGLKIFALADAKVYYTYNLEVYVGQQPEGPFKKSNSPDAVVERLCEPIYGSGRNVTLDNWFTSVSLVQKLLEKKLTVVGTIRKNKRELPVEFVTPTGRKVKSSLFGFQENCTLVSYVPKKNKNVLLISSMHHDDAIDPATGEDCKPEIITLYNSTKGGVDTVDQLCSNYNCARNTQRWPMVVFYSSLNVAGINSLVLYGANNPDTSLVRRSFLRKLAMSLVEPHLRLRIQVQSIPSRIKDRIRELYSIAPSEEEERKVQHGRCHYCDAKRNRKTRYCCKKCKKFMCLEHVTIVCDACYETSHD